MKLTLSTNNAVDMLKADEYAAWSWAGARAMVEYLEQLEEDLGEEIEMDVIAIRCDYSEYYSALDCVSEYDYDGDQSEDSAIEWLKERTTVIVFDGGVIVGAF